ncbi:hypothetical protein BZG36_04015 [Bifiguratus adelaidae]|uniref:PQ-loop repeat-containing protein 1 n=1 Tax=Bifiguratus adelaidae TaxID=1938954 RepID=A0A261XYP7_9FUNG|nr:hypothetical protein BZG36_04015 [Bifiguratus adelaidae]
MAITDAFHAGLQLAMVVGPVVGYVDQYFIMRRTRTSEGFNIATCGARYISLVCNTSLYSIVRIFFWLGKRFDTTLLFQSIVMIAVQFVLLEAVIRHRPTGYQPLQVPTSPIRHHHTFSDTSSAHSQESDASSIDFTPEYPPTSKRTWRTWASRFWAWNAFSDYLLFLGLFTAAFALLYLLLGGYNWFVELLGFISLGIEATVPMPQWWMNFRRKDVDGFSILILGSWFLGDSFKFFYFIYTHSPLQFILCGAIQLSVDVGIVVQFFLYSRSLRRRLGLKVDDLPYIEDDLVV